MCPQTLGLLAAGWVLLAVFVGEIQLLELLPPVAVPVLILALAGLTIGCYFRCGSLRQAINGWGEKPLIGLHLVRFVGIYFLVLSARGELEPPFAVPAGWGDITVAAFAAFLLVAFRKVPAWLLLTWNTAGLLDILFVVGKAAALRSADSGALEPLLELPLSFLPTLIVPLIIASHIILYTRVFASRPVLTTESVGSNPERQDALSGRYR